MTNEEKIEYYNNLRNKAEKIEFNSASDALMALDNGKIDAFPADESLYYAMRWEEKNYSIVEEPMATSTYGMIFGKGANQDLRAELNAFLSDNKETVAVLEAKWFSEKEPTEFMSYDDLTGQNGTLRIGVCSSVKPFVYMKDGRPLEGKDHGGGYPPA